MKTLNLNLNGSLDSNILNMPLVECSRFLSEGTKRKFDQEKSESTKKSKVKQQRELDLGGFSLIVAPKSGKNMENIADFEKIAKKEYNQVCKDTPYVTHKLNMQEKLMRFPTACSFDNWRKNRYNDVLCNEETRFLFKSVNRAQSFSNISFDMELTQEEVVEEKKYINANNISGTHPCNSKFIATQAPLEETLAEFFEMIWQSQTSLIITLSSIIEAGRTKMFQFWPEKNQTLKYGQFLISLEKEAKNGSGITIRMLSLYNCLSSTKRIIYQLHYTGWPDNGVPSEPSSLIQIYKYQKLFEEEGKKQDLNGPTVVHCSAGIGRTATYMSFVYAAQIVEHLRKSNYPLDSNLLNSHINIPNIVNNIRKQRSGSIQNSDQYAFVYKALNYYLK